MEYIFPVCFSMTSLLFCGTFFNEHYEDGLEIYYRKQVTLSKEEVVI